MWRHRIYSAKCIKNKIKLRAICLISVLWQTLLHPPPRLQTITTRWSEPAAQLQHKIPNSVSNLQQSLTDSQVTGYLKASSNRLPSGPLSLSLSLSARTAASLRWSPNFFLFLNSLFAQRREWTSLFNIFRPTSPSEGGSCRAAFSIKPPAARSLWSNSHRLRRGADKGKRTLKLKWFLSTRNGGWFEVSLLPFFKYRNFLF